LSSWRSPWRSCPFSGELSTKPARTEKPAAAEQSYKADRTPADPPRTAIRHPGIGVRSVARRNGREEFRVDLIAVMTSRRTFLYRSGLSLLPATLRAARELRCDVAVIGAGTGGCAAALAALRNGMQVVLTEETDWVGGQLTSQGVPPDEYPWIESFGGTGLYASCRRGVRDYYRTHYPLTAAARARTNLNPCGGRVSRITHEPRVSLEVLEAMLAPYVSGGQLTLLLNHKPTKADVQSDHVRAVTVRSTESGDERTIHAPYFLDATELGDLLPLTKTEFVPEFESQRDTGELHAPKRGATRQSSSFHGMLRDRPPARRGSYDRAPGRIQEVARLRPCDETAMARQAAELAHESPANLGCAAGVF